MPKSSPKSSEKGSEKSSEKTPQKTTQKTWIASKSTDDVTQMRFGANEQRTTTIDWCGRLGITESWYRGIPTGAGDQIAKEWKKKKREPCEARWIIPLV